MRYRFQTETTDTVSRLDQFLALRIPDLSRTELRARIELGGVHIQGKRVRKCGLQLKAGCKVELYLDRGPLRPFRLKPANILYRDPWLLAVNKPAGVESQPTPARLKGCLYEAVETYLQMSRTEVAHRGRQNKETMVQRLDRDTSGVIILSIHKASHAKLTEMVRRRALTREYLALVEGCPASDVGEYRNLLARRSRGRSVAVHSGGKEAVTRFRLLQQFSDYSAIAATLLTGRTHQIRAQFSENGHPLLGDKKYGGATEICGVTIPRHCLHARRLSLIHPITGQALEIEAPVPQDLLRFL